MTILSGAQIESRVVVGACSLFSPAVLDRSEGLAPSRGRAIVRSEVQSDLLPYFLEDHLA